MTLRCKTAIYLGATLLLLSQAPVRASETPLSRLATEISDRRQGMEFCSEVMALDYVSEVLHNRSDIQGAILQLKELAANYSTQGPPERYKYTIDWITKLYTSLPAAEKQSLAGPMMGCVGSIMPGKDQAVVVAPLLREVTDSIDASWPNAENLALSLPHLAIEICGNGPLGEHLHQRARELLLTLHSKNAYTAYEYMCYADSEFKDSNFVEAEKFYKEALKISDSGACVKNFAYPSNAEFVLRLAKTYAKQGKNEALQNLVKCHLKSFEHMKAEQLGFGDELISLLLSQRLIQTATMVADGVLPGLQWETIKPPNCGCSFSPRYGDMLLREWAKTCALACGYKTTKDFYDHCLDVARKAGYGETASFARAEALAVTVHWQADDAKGAWSLYHDAARQNERHHDYFVQWILMEGGKVKQSQVRTAVR